LSKPESNDSDEKTVVEDLLNNLSVQVFSESLSRDGIYFIGSKALNTPQNIRNMNISIGNKSTQDIPIITSLSMLAGIALRKYFSSNSKVPKTLTLKVKMATAIPSSEYSKTSAKNLEDRFKGEHTVNLYVGEKTVLVTINITDCKVTEEGKTAMLAFLNSPNDILEIYNEDYNEKATPKDFATASALHGDIGDGTSEIIFTQGFNPVSNGSFGVRVGVGHATTEAIRLYRDELGGMIGDITRQHFMKLLGGESEKSKIAKEKMKEATYIQGQKIIECLQQGFLEKTASTAEYFFIHGGGSIVFKNDMKEALKNFADTIRARVVWIPPKYATSMNSRGTLYLAKALFCKNNDEE
jgi:plasmid segregation protein ParM